MLDKAAQAFVDAANKLMEVSGAFAVSHDMVAQKYGAQLAEKDFDTISNGREVQTKPLDSARYPGRIIKSFVAGGMEFYCVNRKEG